MPTTEEDFEAAFQKLKAPPEEDADFEAGFKKLSGQQSPDLFAGLDRRAAGIKDDEEPLRPAPANFSGESAKQAGLRFGVGAAGALGELGASIGNMVSRGTPYGAIAGMMGNDPFKFSARDYINRAQHLDVLTEANWIGRTSELLGEGIVNIGSLIAGSGALQAAGYSARVANAVSIVGATMMGHQQQAAATGQPVSGKDLAWSLAYTAAAIPAGHLLGKGLVKAVEAAKKAPLGKAMKAAIENTSMATVFQTQNMAKQVPDWKERWLADALTFNILSTHDALYPGETRPRTKGAARQSFEALDALNAERGLGTSKNPTPEVARAEAKNEATPGEMLVRISKARSYAENQQANLEMLRPKTELGETGEARPAETAPPDVISGTNKPATAFDLMAMFEIPQKDAQRIADRRLTEAERNEILGERETEAVVAEAEKRGGMNLVMETLYSRDLLSDLRRAGWEDQRAKMTPEDRSALEEAVPTRDEALAAAEGQRFDERLNLIPETDQTTFPMLEGTGPTGALPEQAGPAAPAAGALRPTESAAVPRGASSRARGEATAPPPPSEPVDRTAPMERELHPEAAAATAEIARAPMEAEPGPVTQTTEPASEAVRGTAPGSAEAPPEKPTTAPKPLSPEEVTPAGPRKNPWHRILAELGATDLGPKRTEEQLRRLDEKIEGALNAKKKARLSPEDLGKLAVGGLTLGAYLGAKAADDDETREAWQQLAAMPALFLLGRGRKLAPEARAEFEASRGRAEGRDAERVKHDAAIRERVEKAIAKGSALIYTGKPGPTKVLDISNEMKDLIPESTASPQSTSLKNTKQEIGRSAVGSLKNYYGPTGEMTGRLITDAERSGRMIQEKLEYEHNRMDTGPYGDSPNKPLSKKEAKILNEYMDWTLDQSLPKPDIEALKKGSPKLKRELYTALHALHGEKLLADLSPEQRATVIENTRLYDESYAARLKEGQDSGLNVQPLYTHNGRYRPVIHEDYVFDPPVSLKHSRIPGKRAEYYERLDVADRYQKAIAKASGVPLHVVREALRGEQEQGGPWSRRPIEQVIAKKATSLDYHRVFDTPIGSKWSPSGQYLSYVDGAVPRMEISRRFGPNGELADTMFKLAEKDGYGRADMTELYDYATGQHPKYLSGFESWYGRGLGHVSSFVRFGALGRFVQPQFLQLLAPAMSAGRNPVEAMKLVWQQKLDAIGGSISMSADLPKGVREKLGNDIAARIASNAGVGLKAIYLQEQAHVKSPFARLTTMLLKGQGGTVMDRAARVQGALVGDAWFKVVREMQLAAVRSGDAKKIDQSRQFMEELFRDEPVLLEQAKRTDISKAEEDYLAQVAAQNLSDRWNHHVAPSTMPLMYSHPVGRHMYTLGTFQYRQTATFHRVMEDARRYPATRLRMAALGGLLTGSGMLLLYTRRLGQPGAVDHDDPFWLDVVNGAAFSWFAPLYVNLANSLFHNPTRSAVGPTHAFVWDMGETWKRSVEQKSFTPFEKLVLRRGIPQHPIPGLPQPRDMILEEVGQDKPPRRRRRRSNH